MFGIGAQEVVVVAFVFLILFGPGKLPEVAREMGAFVGKLREAAGELGGELTSADYPDEWFEEPRHPKGAEKREPTGGPRDP